MSLCLSACGYVDVTTGADGVQRITLDLLAARDTGNHVTWVLGTELGHVFLTDDPAHQPANPLFFSPPLPPLTFSFPFLFGTGSCYF